MQWIIPGSLTDDATSREEEHQLKVINVQGGLPPRRNAETVAKVGSFVKADRKLTFRELCDEINISSCVRIILVSQTVKKKSF